MKKGLCFVRDTCRGDNPQGVHPQGSAVAGGIGKSGLPTHENKSLATVSQSCSTVTSTQTLYAVNENFTNLTTGDLVLPAWQISTTSTTGTVDTDGGGNKALKIVSSVLYGGFVRYFSTINGTSYTVKVKIKNTHQTNISIRRRDPNNYANYQQVTGQLKSASAGYVELTFTFTAQSGWEYYLHVQNQTATGTTVTYYADDIQVYYTGTVTQTLCTDDNSYRYGFNNQEKDNELYGTEGTAYAFEYRIHDTRLGRFLSVDPLAPEYPWNSSYAFAENKVIWAKDLEGTELSFVTDPIFDKLKEVVNASDLNDGFKGTITFFLGGAQQIYQMGDLVRGGYDLLNTTFQSMEAGLPILMEAMQRGITWEDVKALGINTPAGKLIAGKVQQINTIINGNGEDKYDNAGKLAAEVFMLYLTAKMTSPKGVTESPTPKKAKSSELPADKQLIPLRNKTPQTQGESISVKISDGNLTIGDRAVSSGNFDFVVTAEGKLLVGQGHSYMAGGKAVQAAGQIKLYKGRITSINNSSGHYLPTILEAGNYVKIFETLGVDMSNVKVKLYNTDGTLHVTK